MKKAERNAILEPARKKLEHDMATEEPKNWRLPADVPLRKYSEAWANEMLPLAREAHERLVLKNVHPLQQHDRVIAVGEVEEKPGSQNYRQWASGVVREELHKAGWRLADLLEKSLSTPAKPSTPSESGEADKTSSPAVPALSASPSGTPESQ